MIEAIVVDADKGVIARAVAPDAERIANPVPAAQVALAGGQPGAADPDRIAAPAPTSSCSSSSASRSSW